MANKTHQFTYELHENESCLSPADQALLQAAREHTAAAYAPYSAFKVAAVAQTTNGHIVKGTNQENASYPVGICAERVLLSALSTLHPTEAVATLAISYHNLHGNSGKPASPCGMCRQALVEYEQRFNQPMRLILSGQQGEVMVIASAKDILPFGFTAEDMK